MFHAFLLTSINKSHVLKNTGFISARVSLCLQKYDFFSRSGLRCVCGVVCVLYADQYLIPWEYGVRLLNIFTFQRFDFGCNFNIKYLYSVCYIEYFC